MFKRPWVLLLMTPVIFVNCNNNNPTVTILPPAINSQPESQIVRVGSPVTFSVSVTGDPVPTCQWLKQGIPLTGENDTLFTIPAVDYPDSGTYSVVVSNSEGEVSSDMVTLIVYSVTVTPQSDTVSVDSAFAFTASVTGIPGPAYQWRLEGFNVPGATGLTYSKTSATLDDAGTYRLVVTSPVEDVFSDPVTLLVNP